MLLNTVLGWVALLSLGLTLWQWVVARRFPLHQRLGRLTVPEQPGSSPRPAAPGVTLLKAVKGCDAATEACLRSWFAQEYEGNVQILFGVASAEDPVCGIVRRLMEDFPGVDAQLVVCGPPRGANAKVSQLVAIERLAKHELVVVSDADVRAPGDLLTDVLARLREPEVGLVNCFYRLANASTLAMQWEAVAINADFWSSVLQSRSLKPLDFALGAVMATRRQQLEEVGGFGALIDCLADDYQLGHRIARRGHAIALSGVVVECWSEPVGWAAVWKHQLRWARTIRVCQPGPYFLSILSNATLWPLLWLGVYPSWRALAFAAACGLVRMATALNLQQRLSQTGARVQRDTGRHSDVAAPEDGRAPAEAQLPLTLGWVVLLKDLLQTAIWLLAFLGNRIEWRGERMVLRRDGTLVKERS